MSNSYTFIGLSHTTAKHEQFGRFQTARGVVILKMATNSLTCKEPAFPFVQPPETIEHPIAISIVTCPVTGYVSKWYVNSEYQKNLGDRALTMEVQVDEVYGEPMAIIMVYETVSKNVLVNLTHRQATAAAIAEWAKIWKSQYPNTDVLWHNGTTANQARDLFLAPVPSPVRYEYGTDSKELGIKPKWFIHADMIDHHMSTAVTMTIEAIRKDNGIMIHAEVTGDAAGMLLARVAQLVSDENEFGKWLKQWMVRCNHTTLVFKNEWFSDLITAFAKSDTSSKPVPHKAKTYLDEQLPCFSLVCPETDIKTEWYVPMDKIEHHLGTAVVMTIKVSRKANGNIVNAEVKSAVSGMLLARVKRRIDDENEFGKWLKQWMVSYPGTTLVFKEEWFSKLMAEFVKSNSAQDGVSSVVIGHRTDTGPKPERRRFGIDLDALLRDMSPDYTGEKLEAWLKKELGVSYTDDTFDRVLTWIHYAVLNKLDRDHESAEKRENPPSLSQIATNAMIEGKPEMIAEIALDRFNQGIGITGSPGYREHQEKAMTEEEPIRYPSRGELITVYCNGEHAEAVFADGHNGSYKAPHESFSAECCSVLGLNLKGLIKAIKDDETNEAASYMHKKVHAALLEGFRESSDKDMENPGKMLAILAKTVMSWVFENEKPSLQEPEGAKAYCDNVRSSIPLEEPEEDPKDKKVTSDDLQAAVFTIAKCMQQSPNYANVWRNNLARMVVSALPEKRSYPKQYKHANKAADDFLSENFGVKPTEE